MPMDSDYPPTFPTSRSDAPPVHMIGYEAFIHTFSPRLLVPARYDEKEPRPASPANPRFFFAS